MGIVDDARTRRLLEAVHRLVLADGATGKLRALGRLGAVVEIDDGSHAIMLAVPRRSGADGPEDDLGIVADKLQEIIEGNPAHLKVVVIGGGEQARRVAAAAQPRWMFRRMVQAFHLDDDGTLWTGRSTRPDSPMGRVLTAVGRQEDSVEIDPARLLSHLQAPPDSQDMEAAREHNAFVRRFRSRRPVATRALLVAIGLVFVAEAVWGGSELIPTLVRMGANTDEALGSEPWRLISSAFLHAGAAHVLINGYVLYALGGFVERVIGWPRFLLLYAAAALGGGLASAALSEAGVSVGASGAIWGLLGAAAALAWRPGGVLPRSLVAPMRRTAIINLAINLMVSFIPRVDMMAHLGGGLVGAVLVLSGLLTRGLPPIESDEDEPVARRRWLQAGAVAMGLLMVGSVATAWVSGAPWELAAQPKWTTVELSAGVRAEVPTMLGPPTRESGPTGEQLWLVGNAERDPIQALVQIVDAVELHDQPWQEAITQLQDVPLGVPPGAQPVGKRTYPDAPGAVFEERFRYPSGMVTTIRLLRLPTAEVLVRVDAWPSAPQPWGPTAVHRLLDGVEPVASAGASR